MSLRTNIAHLAVVAVTTLAIGACTTGARTAPSSHITSEAPGRTPPSSARPLSPPSPRAVPEPLVDARLDLRSPPVAVPLQLEVPSLGIIRSVLAVGITTGNIMDAPVGSAPDPIWQQAFWYRGGGIPGDTSTATIAGHVDDPLGRPAIFAHLGDLHPGDPVVVRDLRTDLTVTFVVARTDSYTLDQAATPSALVHIYGAGPVAGTGPQPAPDGLSHLILITCSGNFNKRIATHDHRIVVDATRVA